MVVKSAGTYANVVLSVAEPLAGMLVYRVINPDTGEVLFESRQDNIKDRLNSGTGIAEGNVRITKDIKPDGTECHTVTDNTGAIVLTAWGKKRTQRNRGGRKSYLKLHPDAMEELPDHLIAPLVRLSHNIMVDGTLSDKQRRRKLSRDKLFEAWGVGQTKGGQIIKELKELGVLTRQDNVYRINKKYLGRG